MAGMALEEPSTGQASSQEDTAIFPGCPRSGLSGSAAPELLEVAMPSADILLTDMPGSGNRIAAVLDYQTFQVIPAPGNYSCGQTTRRPLINRSNTVTIAIMRKI